LDFFFSSRKERKIAEAAALFKSDMRKWQLEKESVSVSNEKEKQKLRVKLETWENERKIWSEEQAKKILEVQKRKEDYLSGDPDAIIDYCDAMLSNSEYPDWFPQDYDLDYNPASKMLIIEYSLPSLDSMPRLAEVKYIQSRNELKEVWLNPTKVNELYDSLIYQITLRTIYELFEADMTKALESIVFNGWVQYVDTATGQSVRACIVSIQTGKSEFKSMNLAAVDPKACFKRLKGIGSSKLHGLSPIAPILQINREDPRFVCSYEVAHTLDESSNIAAMDWQDFEHLIREMFEKEFAATGAEVKITRASRDHGVDGVAFDPDPIRGGKIVIQAKRYTNTVDVAAVRDLYGTVVNEGAIKGILVTTSDYGPDAYNFAKDKPLTLLNGGNLLHMLSRHGYRAKIDLKGAKGSLLAAKNNKLA
jgi:restriction system protein